MAYYFSKSDPLKTLPRSVRLNFFTYVEHNQHILKGFVTTILLSNNNFPINRFDAHIKYLDQFSYQTLSQSFFGVHLSKMKQFIKKEIQACFTFDTTLAETVNDSYRV